jgi:hypothetical protein
MAVVTRDPERLAHAIHSTRAELDETLAALRGAMSAGLDWRTWVARHPYGAISLAVLVGYWLGRTRR